jgi:hypothetical protein
MISCKENEALFVYGWSSKGTVLTEFRGETIPGLVHVEKVENGVSYVTKSLNAMFVKADLTKIGFETFPPDVDREAIVRYFKSIGLCTAEVSKLIEEQEECIAKLT